MDDGRTMTVRVDLFSPKDQKYVAEWMDTQNSNRMDWPTWRGPTLNNIAPSGSSVPSTFSETQNVIWKTNIPGRGASSPIVIGDKVILTTANEVEMTQLVICLSRSTGQQLWQTEVHRGTFTPKIHKKNTHATPTPAWDGERLIVSFYNNFKVILSALDLNGKILWTKDTGEYRDQYQFGYAASPVIYGSNVIVSSEDSNGYIAAFDRKSGKEVWRTTRSGNSSYSSPIISKAGGHELLILTGNDKVTAYDPKSGNESWVVPGIAKATCGTVVWEGDLIFGSGGYPKKETIAVNARTQQVVWRNLDKSYEQSMLAVNGYLYTLNDNGIAICWKASDGEEMWKTRLGGPVSASPILVGDTIVASNEKGQFFIFKANPQRFELISQTQMGDESFASPAISGNLMIIRVASKQGGTRQETVFCIGEN
jgi:outer membrane protein assembly factor BamB